jgi:hypothetical protein
MRCFFDNNLPPKLAKTLSCLEGSDGIPIEHLKDKFSPDTPDVEWLKKLSGEGNWFIITRDNQIRNRSHERKAWQESHLPVVFLQKSWMNHNLWEIAWRFIKYWPELKQNVLRNKKANSFLLSIKGKISVID